MKSKKFVGHSRLVKLRRKEAIETAKRGIAIQVAFLEAMIISYAVGDVKTRRIIRGMFK